MVSMSNSLGDSWFKGNYAEHLAAHVLSRMCFVRPVVGNTDIGVDLYCESMPRGKPFLHFWVQVKGSEKFPDKKTPVPFRFDVSSLNYWARQPVPVLAFLVPVKWPPRDARFIHVVDVTLDVLQQGIRQNNKTQVLISKPDLILPVSSGEGLAPRLQSLLVDHIPMVVSAMYAAQGFVFPAPKPHNEPVKFFSGHFLSRCVPLIAERIKHAAAFGVIYFLAEGKSVDALPGALVAALESLKDEETYEVHEALGMLSEKRGDMNRARACYRRAIQCIKTAPGKNPRRPPWSENLERLKKRLQALSRFGDSSATVGPS
jgi:Domain of unknown function (DUF4365)